MASIHDFKPERRMAQRRKPGYTPQGELLVEVTLTEEDYREVLGLVASASSEDEAHRVQLRRILATLAATLDLTRHHADKELVRIPRQSMPMGGSGRRQDRKRIMDKGKAP